MHCTTNVKTWCGFILIKCLCFYCVNVCWDSPHPHTVMDKNLLRDRHCMVLSACWCDCKGPRSRCWSIVNWTLRNKLQWNLNQDTNFLSMKMHLKISFAEWRTLCPGIVNGIFDVATNLWKDFIQEISFYASSYRTVNTLDGATSERVINYQR